MVLTHRCSCNPCLIFLRNMYIHSALKCKHYKALGVSSSATQAEIKSAYYELSKKHHPDKNQGSEKSAEKFRDITAAYEILGNEKLRKQYDREQLVRSTETECYQANYRTDYSDDFERMYYERRKHSPRRYGYGRTKYYDFSAWYQAHYSDYINQKYYWYNFKPPNSRIYQEPYYKNYDEPLKKMPSNMQIFIFLFVSSGIIFYYLKTNVR